jgi:hypothetical protein
MEADTVAERSEATPAPPLHTLAGALSGAIAASLTQPLEVIKTRMQAERREAHRRPRYAGLYSSVRTILNDEGPRGLFVGLVPSTLALVPALGSFFTIYSSVKAWMDPAETDDTTFFTLKCATSAGIAWSLTSVLTNPLWLMRTRAITRMLDETKCIHLLTKEAHRPTMRNLLQEIVGEGGLGGLYRGTLVSMAGFPAASVQFALYENLRRLIDCEGAQRVYYMGIASLTSAILSQLVCFPLEVLRTRVQSGLEGPRIRLFHLVRNMIYREGISSFYRGLGPSMLRTVPNTALALISYEFLLEFFQKLTL